jgi:hypothetical protein
MSRDFHLRCCTCTKRSDDWNNTWGRGCDLNWQGDKLLALLPHLSLFAAVAETGYDIDPKSLDLFGSLQPRGIGAFALAHRGHDIGVWDEYGEEWKPS